MSDLPGFARTGHAPPWAAEWGEDEHGVFVGFQVKGVVHTLRWIRPGRFIMGSPEKEEGRYDHEGPQHTAVITQGFWLGATAVSQALWQAVMGENPSRFQDQRRPVDTVSWEDTQQFIAKLNASASTSGFRLPSEAEWEYACRAGTTTRYWSGDTKTDLLQVGWCSENSEDQSHHVGLKPANPWGLHDMHGNVFEWCQDGLAPYEARELVDPTGPARGESRVIRGGSWRLPARNARSAYRNGIHPGLRYGPLGFRLARAG
jgi:formylglycine-generating enzyme required for sulfatase activity